MGAQWRHALRQTAGSAKGKIFSKLAKEIIVAARGGADLASNHRLRAAVTLAKKQSMPRETLERAIKKGAGLLEPVNYEMVTYEGFGPHRVPVVVECLTDNKNRTATNVRMLFRKYQLGNSGTVTWDFNYLGIIEASPAEGTTPDVESAAIEAGAQDFEAGADGATIFYTEPTDLDAVNKALTAAGWATSELKLGWKAKNPIAVDADARTEITSWLGEVDEDDDVQNIYVALA